MKLQYYVGIVLSLIAASANATWPAALNENGRPSLSPLLEEVTPAVVNISVTGKASLRRNPLFEDPFFRRFFNLPEQGPTVPRQSVGSGVIIDAKEGYVLTNHHVVANADEIVVTLKDRRRLQATLVGSDAGTDIALLQIEADRLEALELGDSTSLNVGDFVVAIGNPFGLGQTVTSGIVSALGRSGLNIEGYEDFIQTDASINPGNSGGALVDLDGRLVGINTAIIAPAGGNVGIGFAVPMHMARAVMAQLLEHGEVRRGRLGVFIQDLTPDLAEALELDTAEGAVVTQVEPGSSADHAGLKAGDVIIAVDGRTVASSTALRNLIGLTPVGESVRLTVLRDSEHITLDAEVGQASSNQLTGGRAMPKLDGAQFENLHRAHPRYGEISGVLVQQVEQDSPAWRNGLRAGDIILAVNRRSIVNIDDLAKVLDQATSAVALNILRGETRLFIVVQ